MPHLVDLHDLARRLTRGLRRGLAGRAQPPVDRDVADAQEPGDHALAGVARGVEQDRQGLHGLGFAALRRGGEVAAAGLAEVALVAPYPAVPDERRPGAPLAAHLDQPCPPDPAVEPSYQAVDLWVNVSRVLGAIRCLKLRRVLNSHPERYPPPDNGGRLEMQIGNAGIGEFIEHCQNWLAPLPLSRVKNIF